VHGDVYRPAHYKISLCRTGFAPMEADKAHTTPSKRRHLDRISVLEQCSDGSSAFKSYREILNVFPDREYYYVHTS